MLHQVETAGMRWRLEDFNFEGTDVARVRDRDDVFLLLCGASFIESGSETYTRNLVDYFAADPELSAWLRQSWEPEELQHGRALKAYIQHVWPEYNWELAYSGFFSEFVQLCTQDALESTGARELVARCVVESATTTYYQAISSVCDEPVLRDLLSRIRGDELQHYKNFYHHFLLYRKKEGLGRRHVLASILRRLVEIQKTDAKIALRHAAGGRDFADRPAPITAEAATQFAYARLGAAYPLGLAIRMVLKPLQLQARIQRGSEAMMVTLARHLLSR